MEKKFSKNIYSDEESFYMGCPEIVAMHLAERIKEFDSVVELCCGVGVTSIQLAKKVKKVYGVDKNSSRIKFAKENMKLYNVDNITFIQGDVLNKDLFNKIKADVVIIDPDWSEKGDIKKNHTASIEKTQPNLKKLFEIVVTGLTKNIVVRIPKDWSFDNLNELGLCKLENIIWKNEVKFKFAYFFENIRENKEENIVFELK